MSIVILDMVQGSPEWLQARLGIPTASEFSRIITPSKGDLSKSAAGYAQELVTEILLGEPLESSVGNLDWVVRGKLLEPQAVAQYEFTMDVETMPVGFVTTDDGRVGCSPDRLLVGSRGCMEVKCPKPATHMGYLLDGPGLDYRCQIQGQLAIGEFAFCDFYSFHPALPPALLRVERDEPFIAKLNRALAEFLAMRDDMLMRAHAAGAFADRREAA